MNCNCKYKCFIGVTIDFKHKIIKANPPNTKIIKLSYLMSSRIKTFLIDFITYFSVLPWIFKFYIFEKKNFYMRLPFGLQMYSSMNIPFNYA